MNRELTRLMDHHRITLVSGTPDYETIRKIEREIHGEAFTPYPGEWDDVTPDEHWKRHRRYLSDLGDPRCLLCEDHRRSVARIKSEAEAKYAKDDRSWLHRVPWHVWPIAVVVLATMTVFTLAPLIILAAL